MCVLVNWKGILDYKSKNLSSTRFIYLKCVLYVTMEPIQYSGISELNEEEKEILSEISAKNYERLRNLLQNEQTAVTVHIKTYREKNDTEKSS